MKPISRKINYKSSKLRKISAVKRKRKKKEKKQTSAPIPKNPITSNSTQWLLSTSV